MHYYIINSLNQFIFQQSTAI